MNDIVWGLPGAKVTPELQDAKAFSETPLLDILQTAARRSPDSVALVGLSGELRYGDLMRLALNAAQAVAALAPLGAPVACILPRTPEAVAALLGCLLSGRLCLVIDPNNPAERQAALLADAAPALLLVDRAPPFSRAIPVLTVADALAGAGEAFHVSRPWDPDAPLVVHFTSGSTGRPKGIVLSARSVLFRALDSMDAWSLTAEDRVFAPSIFIQGSGSSFLLGCLARRARILLADLARERLAAVVEFLEREAVTRVSLVPSIMRMLSELDQAARAFRAVLTLRIGAAALLRADVARWRPMLPRDCAILHAYASTEALIVAQWVLPPDDDGPEPTVAAGMIRPSQDYALLDDGGDPVRPGEIGELVLRGRCFALGEWRDGRVVAGRMVPDPDMPGWRIFRTGDLALIQPDGLLRVVGRVDRQVKINGVRVEPAEIEAALRGEPGVFDAAVVATPAAAGVVLTGYVAASPADEAALLTALRARLAAALPSALRPSRLIVLDRLPMLPGGKIDYVTLKGKATG